MLHLSLRNLYYWDIIVNKFKLYVSSRWTGIEEEGAKGLGEGIAKVTGLLVFKIDI